VQTLVTVMGAASQVVSRRNRTRWSRGTSASKGSRKITPAGYPPGAGEPQRIRKSPGRPPGLFFRFTKQHVPLRAAADL
jgi:hypothetical protein